MADIKLDIGPFNKLNRAIKRAGSAASNAPMGMMFIQWGARYMTFVRRNFMRSSRGGGGWAPLKRATARRRKGARKSRKGKKRRHAILINTRTLFNAISLGMPGNLRQRIRKPGGIRVGFSNDRHNNDKITIRKLAIIHDSGLGNNPQRIILAAPDNKTTNGMMSDAARATQALMKSLAI